jgi:RNA polymerase sigma-70 factor (ECF subfamily)
VNGTFPTTQWSVVLAGADSRSPDYHRALETLCRRYWYSVYAHARQLGNDPDAAQDLTQGFFVHILEKQTLKVADPDRGRFRAFLKATFQHYLANERRRARAQKRGGGKRVLGLDFDNAESQYTLEPSRESTPETSFEKRWARMLLTRALARLEAEMRATQDGERFRHLEPFLTGRPDGAAHDRAASALGMTVPSVRVAVHRMRRRFGRLLREDVAETVSDPAEVDDELRHIFAVLDT